MPLVLASSSAIRRAMLEAAGVEHQVIAAGIDETALKARLGEAEPATIALELAKAKAAAGSARSPDDWVIGSDSVVSINGRLFDKPADRRGGGGSPQVLLRQDDGADQRRRACPRWRRSTGAIANPRPCTCASCPTNSSKIISRANGPPCPIASACSASRGPACNCSAAFKGDHFTILGMPLLPLLGALRDRGVDCRMIKIALTGSIGMGKSTVARMFERAGVPLFDADAEVRRLQGPGGALVAAIAQRFPGGVRDGVIDRDALVRVGARQSRRARCAGGHRPPRGADSARAIHRRPCVGSSAIVRHPLAVRNRRRRRIRQGHHRLRAGRDPARAGARRGRE